MPKPVLPAVNGDLSDRVKAKTLDAGELAVIAPLANGHKAAVDAFNRAALEAQAAQVAAQIAQLDGGPAPTPPSYVDEIARRRLQLAHMEAQLDLDEALSELGERYAVTDPRNRISKTDGKIQR